VHATLFFCAFNALLDQRQKNPRQTYAYLAYIVAQFSFGTIAYAVNTKFVEQVFITDRDFPGGPSAFFNNFQADVLNFVGYIFYIMMAWMQDLLLIWRYFIFWNNNYWLTAVPLSLFTVSFVVGTLLLAQVGQPGANIWTGTNVNFFTTFWAAEITTTLWITTLIVGRLMYMRYRLTKVMGPGHQSQYLSIAAMLCESGLLYSAGAVTFVIAYTYDSPFQNMVLNMVGQLEGIAPVLIILRVAQGHGLTRQKIQETGTTLRTGGSSGRSHVVPLKHMPARGDTMMGSRKMSSYNSDPTATENDAGVVVNISKYTDNSGSFIDESDRV